MVVENLATQESSFVFQSFYAIVAPVLGISISNDLCIQVFPDGFGVDATLLLMFKRILVKYEFVKDLVLQTCNHAVHWSINCPRSREAILDE